MVSSARMCSRVAAVRLSATAGRGLVGVGVAQAVAPRVNSRKRSRPRRVWLKARLIRTAAAGWFDWFGWFMAASIADLADIPQGGRFFPA